MIKCFFELMPSFINEPIRFAIQDIEDYNLSFLPSISQEISCAQPPPQFSQPQPSPQLQTSPQFSQHTTITPTTFSLISRTPSSYIDFSIANFESSQVARKLNFSISSLIN